LAPPRREKEESEEEEEEQISPELLEDTRPWWVANQEMLAKLSRHPDDPKDAPGLSLAVAHSLAGAGGAAGGAPGGPPVFDISDSDDDIKPDMKMGTAAPAAALEGVAVAAAGAMAAVRVRV
jgi:hypothetical protein